MLLLRCINASLPQDWQPVSHIKRRHMTIKPMRLAQRGFTLIELLIVVIILAILAAIVIPQFSNSSGEAREASLDANLATMRSAIELYKLQHKNTYPGAVAATGNGTAAACASPGAVGGVVGAQSFMDQLTAASDAAGNTCTVAGPGYTYGPYLRGPVPAEPINGKGALVTEITVTGTGVKPVPATGAAGGWLFDTKSGNLVTNILGNDSKGVAFANH